MAFDWLRFFIDEHYLSQLTQDLSTVLLLAVMATAIAMVSKGADWMIDGVVHLAQRTRVPRIVIGATIVSLGTTLPEAFVSVMAAWMGNPGLALGNGVGSIIADTGLIFGMICIVSRVPVDRFILNRTGWMQVGAATLLVLIALALLVAAESQPIIPRWVGILFLALLLLYLYLTYHWACRRAGGGDECLVVDDSLPIGRGKCWGLIVMGLGLVVFGARILIPAAAELAYRIGVPDDVIAATLVAFGTSLPELITAVFAVRKGHPEIMVGNVVGADVLNCLFVIGAAAVASPLAIPDNFYYFHFPALLLILYPFRVFIFINRDGWFKRWQGGWLLGVYVVYLLLQYGLNINS